jgi:hypothetical protein
MFLPSGKSGKSAALVAVTYVNQRNKKPDPDSGRVGLKRWRVGVWGQPSSTAKTIGGAPKRSYRSGKSCNERQTGAPQEWDGLH